jgi:hypothetical protein
MCSVLSWRAFKQRELSVLAARCPKKNIISINIIPPASRFQFVRKMIPRNVKASLFSTQKNMYYLWRHTKIADIVQWMYVYHTWFIRTKNINQRKRGNMLPSVMTMKSPNAYISSRASTVEPILPRSKFMVIPPCYLGGGEVKRMYSTNLTYSDWQQWRTFLQNIITPRKGRGHNAAQKQNTNPEPEFEKTGLFKGQFKLDKNNLPSYFIVKISIVIIGSLALALSAYLSFKSV